MLFALSTKLSSIIGCKDTHFILNVWYWILFCLLQMLYYWYSVLKEFYFF